MGRQIENNDELERIVTDKKTRDAIRLQIDN